MKILLLGKTGQVGFELHRVLSPLGTLVAPDRKALDLSDEDAVSAYLAACRPDLIVNAAAWTAVDAAEEQTEAARRLNQELPAQLAAYAAAASCRLVHYSSDYVYPGTGTEPWTENSPTGPLNTYGRTKLAGDEAVMSSGADYLIFRTSWVYSARGNNFMKTMLRLAQSRSELSIVADQIGAPTPARLIAQITTLGIYNRLDAGVYHLAARGETSWHGFAREIFRMAREAGVSLALVPDRVHPIPTRDYPTPATRPLNSRLNVARLEQALKVRLPDWQSQLALTLAEYLEK
ncbi:dTDP-4-dehydrorhamnose reductase [uncultured Marinobacter sp.]|jgi:dTDP-4-dehydrorhamnose reductase|uniref:dTDP-4-dehydrorhamnose reductase n=1 Tax=uncultured Marinobacter sp. TaxID=187379 RepID=UPI000C0AC80D|nr:dTDP-4-dehydrorhamnose reductase [Marinobacter sp.]MBI43102.1 dTDP-4-dehydrorhamnose reductase [Oceanospirillales bacterium]|tara:strand:- start:1616 stop:2488 length:873 start_codon:yes stop_codon:yes gene_type:complete